MILQIQILPTFLDDILLLIRPLLQKRVQKVPIDALTRDIGTDTQVVPGSIRPVETVGR